MKRQQDHDEDVPFDVEPVMPSVEQLPAAAPKDLLSASKVEAVRFHPAKPGYAYDQVETFVDAVTRTLRYLEQRMYQDDLAIHEANTENELLEEQISTLKATIEVFRANGDPVGAADGGFATASSVEDPALRAERDSLAAALTASQAEVADLRAYIDQQLAPWIAEQAEEAEDESSEELTPKPAESLEPVEVEAPALEEMTSVAPEESIDPEVEEANVQKDEKATFAATAAAFAAQVDDDWDDEDSDEWAYQPKVVTADDAKEEVVTASGPMFSTPEIDALGVEIDRSKVIQTNDSQYGRISPAKAGTPLPRLLPPEIAAMMEAEDSE
jgi:hypothetical protein